MNTPDPHAAFLRRAHAITLGLAVVVPLALLAAAVLQPWGDPSELTRDPLAVAAKRAWTGAPCCSPFLGALSTLGVMLWCAAAAVSGGAAMVLAGLGAPTVRVAVLSLGALFSVWLMADDAFMLHETFGRKLIGPVGLFRLILVILLAATLVALAMSGSRAGFGLLAAALTLFAGSITADDYMRQSAGVIFLEDALKFLGIALWAAFWLIKSLDFSLAAARAAPPVTRSR